MAKDFASLEQQLQKTLQKTVQLRSQIKVAQVSTTASTISKTLAKQKLKVNEKRLQIIMQLDDIQNLTLQAELRHRRQAEKASKAADEVIAYED
jgi:ABC-type phosphate transport system auxiliary subunit